MMAPPTDGTRTIWGGACVNSDEFATIGRRPGGWPRIEAARPGWQGRGMEADPGKLLSIEGLRTVFRTARGEVPAVDGVDLSIARGRTLGIVGESGCGKSILSLSVMRLVPEPGRIAAGSIRFDGRDLLA